MILADHICALIPTYNNGGTIGSVVERVSAQMKHIIVVVDGSTDNTREVLAGLSVQLTIVDYAQNAGKGVALKRGFLKARQMGFTHVLTIDADGQHYPEDIPLLYRAHTIHPDAIVVGSRVLVQKNMPARNTFANRFSNFWFRIQTGLNLPDTQSGFRIYPLERMHGERLMTSRYEAELSLLVFSAWANVPVVPVPVRVYYPPKNERVSHFRPARDFLRISLLNTVLCVFAIIYGLPRRWWRSLYYYPFFALYLLLYITPSMRRLQRRFGDSEEMNCRLHQFVKQAVLPLINGIHGLHPKLQGPNISPQPAIIIANHNSFLDILMLMSMSDKLTFIGKDWVLSNPLFGRLAKGYHIIPASLGTEELLSEIRRVTDLGYSVVVFPEGTRSKTGDIQTFHRGAFYFAEQLSLPIRPVVIRGFYDIWNKTTMHIGCVRNVQIITLPDITIQDPRRHLGYAQMSKLLAAEYREKISYYYND